MFSYVRVASLDLVWVKRNSCVIKEVLGYSLLDIRIMLVLTSLLT